MSRECDVEGPWTVTVTLTTHADREDVRVNMSGHRHVTWMSSQRSTWMVDMDVITTVDMDGST